MERGVLGCLVNQGKSSLTAEAIAATLSAEVWEVEQSIKRIIRDGYAIDGSSRDGVEITKNRSSKGAYDSGVYL